MTEQSVNFSRRKVLIVEDNDFVRMQLVKQVKDLGFGDVLEANDGKAAINLLDSSIDLILCDVHMQPMSGIELLKHVRGLGNTLRTVPFILLTGDSNAEAVQIARKLKVNGYLLKPITTDNLKKKIDPLFTSKENKVSHS